MSSPSVEPVLPFTLKVPTNRADNPSCDDLNVGVNHVEVQVILDSEMELRGECRNGYGGPVIALREWNEQVLLHELLHVATGWCQPLLATTYPPHGHEVISRIEVALWEGGWRMLACDREPVEMLNDLLSAKNVTLDDPEETP